MSRRTRSTTATLSKLTEPATKKATLGSRAAKIAAAPQSPPIRLFDTAVAWETWLAANPQDLTGVWLQIAKKAASKPTVTYDQALDTALCYGWIDGQRKTHDAEHFLQRFTPRRKNSMWSKRNVDKVAVLIQEGRMRAPGQAEIDAAKADGRWERAYAGPSSMQVPADFQAALLKNSSAKSFFEALNKTQRYQFLWRIETTRRPETRRRKIDEYVTLLADHKLL
ncbi:hypothetical protein D7B24_003804 [Verticillium nonalfalfae]|uniref:Bacteriocin-protection protein n=1 Tax=Verticillium nonalfalfae TaxID=1051616 RepID=A0A3M9YF02_9PEZI|nr:uncharacterized protein D7B24_003804 [Verticillium nonalfalfae]RNJ58984.1 hypothetical protein D7B24_003804 [Verticillium nonalfalfae]